MKKTPEEMADHIREAIINANGVLEEAEKESYRVRLSLMGEDTPPIIVEQINLNISL